MRARDLSEAGIPRAYLARLCDRGVLERVDRGLYRLAAAPISELSSLAEVAKRVPHGIVCLLSALQVHGLTTEAPHAVWVLIDRRARGAWGVMGDDVVAGALAGLVLVALAHL